MALIDYMPGSWRALLGDEKPVAELERRLAGEPYQPDQPQLFRALELTPPEKARVVILGQDPYPTPGVPTGLAFSAQGEKLPASLRNIFQEYSADLQLPAPSSGDLSPWARQGVLLLNTCLSCRPGAAGSHAKYGWQPITAQLLAGLAGQASGLVFLCWGRHAQQTVSALPLSDKRTRVLQSNHPSPLAARRPPVPFLGSRPFSAANQALTQLHLDPVEWRLP